MTGNDVTLPQINRSDPGVTSFDRKSRGSGCRMPKTRVYSTFHIIKAVARSRRQSRDSK